jgi:predicted ATPase with chaperone activity
MAVDRLGLSARAHSRILKVAEPSPTWRAAVAPFVHVAEAIQYRASTGGPSDGSRDGTS